MDHIVKIPEPLYALHPKRVLTHSLVVPVVDLVDVPKDYLVLSLHALRDATGIHGRHIPL